MKKRILCIVLFLSVALYGCGYTEADLEEARLSGYEDGYYDGYQAAENKFINDYDDGYDAGFDDADTERVRIIHTIDDAASFAREETGWSVYEAYNNIIIYLDSYDPNGFPLPTYEEFIESVNTLVCFVEYLDYEKLIY